MLAKNRNQKDQANAVQVPVTASDIQQMVSEFVNAARSYSLLAAWRISERI